MPSIKIVQSYYYYYFLNETLIIFFHIRPEIIQWVWEGGRYFQVSDLMRLALQKQTSKLFFKGKVFTNVDHSPKIIQGKENYRSWANNESFAFSFKYFCF